MTICLDCQAADADPHHAGYRADCHGCKVRSMAHSPLFFEAARSGRQFGAYREALAKLGLEHSEVKAASMRLKGLTA